MMAAHLTGRIRRKAVALELARTPFHQEQGAVADVTDKRDLDSKINFTMAEMVMAAAHFVNGVVEHYSPLAIICDCRGFQSRR